MPQDARDVAAAPAPALALLVRLQALGARLQVRRPGSGKGRLGVAPASAYAKLTDAERAALREHRDVLRELVLAGYTPPVESAPVIAAKPAPEPEPKLFAAGHPVTEVLVRESMRRMGDSVLADYLAGRMSKGYAFEITRLGMLQSMELQRAFGREP